ncbi:ABC transporter ATP-binding protein [Salibacterium salarium]|uniref:ABC transporter ATP-binding protein n=1 Tax=Salibacterium salarium TaxID=284579 RepID=A0A428N1R1_9BACI|nr:ABC transporter ATP-binding protein [Salibacterium salarium]RSL32360.1 ABC transporter ATP-binding protein [Salibacterium salarium]
MSEKLLSVKNLSINVQEPNRQTKQKIVQQVNFDLLPGNVLGLLGGNGSGKTLTSLAILNLLQDKFYVSGQIQYQGKDIFQLPKKKLRQIRGNDIAMIAQNPMSSFNPVISIGEHMIESLRAHKSLSRREAKDLAIYYLERMELDNPSGLIKRYPFQLSGGMLQRVMIAITFSLQPKIIIADEPTTALDDGTQEHILHQLEMIKHEYDSSILLISHDFDVVSRLADDIAVMHNGMIVEKGSLVKVFNHPDHFYTKQLIDARMRLKREIT